MLPHHGGPRAPKTKDASPSGRQVLVNLLATFSGLATILGDRQMCLGDPALRGKALNALWNLNHAFRRLSR